MASKDFSQDLIDRLVDGELTPEERQALILRMQADGELCRQVALAFLEAQEWSKCLGSALEALNHTEGLPAGVTDKSKLESLPHAASRPLGVQLPHGTTNAAARAKTRSIHHLAGTLAAMAASLLLGSVASWWALSQWAVRPAKQSTNPAIAATGRPVENGGAAQVPSASDQSLELVTLPVAVEASGESSDLQFPVVSLAGNSPVIVSPAGILPQDFWENLRKHGHTIRQQRHFLPVALPDGREGVMPVDQVEIQFVGQRDFR